METPLAPLLQKDDAEQSSQHPQKQEEMHTSTAIIKLYEFSCYKLM